MTGYPPEAFLQDAALLDSIIHPDDRAKYLDHRCNLIKNPGKQVEFRVIRPDGSICWVGHVCQTATPPP